MRNNPSWHTFLLGFVFTVVGALVLLIGAHRTNLVCQPGAPTEVNCTIQSDWMGYFPQPPRTVVNVQQAVVDESCDSDGCTYRVELNTPFYSEPVTNVFSSGYNGKLQAANQVNAYLQSGTTTPLELRLSLGLGWVALIPVIFILIGLVFMGVVIARLIVWIIGRVQA